MVKQLVLCISCRTTSDLGILVPSVKSTTKPLKQGILCLPIKQQSDTALLYNFGFPDSRSFYEINHEAFWRVYLGCKSSCRVRELRPIWPSKDIHLRCIFVVAECVSTKYACFLKCKKEHVDTTQGQTKPQSRIMSFCDQESRPNHISQTNTEGGFTISQ